MRFLAPMMRIDIFIFIQPPTSVPPEDDYSQLLRVAYSIMPPFGQRCWPSHQASAERSLRRRWPGARITTSAGRSSDMAREDELALLPQAPWPLEGFLSRLLPPGRRDASTRYHFADAWNTYRHEIRRHRRYHTFSAILPSATATSGRRRSRPFAKRQYEARLRKRRLRTHIHFHFHVEQHLRDTAASAAPLFRPTSRAAPRLPAHLPANARCFIAWLL